MHLRSRNKCNINATLTLFVPRIGRLAVDLLYVYSATKLKDIRVVDSLHVCVRGCLLLLFLTKRESELNRQIHSNLHVSVGLRFREFINPVSRRRLAPARSLCFVLAAPAGQTGCARLRRHKQSIATDDKSWLWAVAFKNKTLATLAVPFPPSLSLCVFRFLLWMDNLLAG